MWWIILAVLLLAWLLGLLNGVGGLIHLILVVVLIIITCELATSRRV
jgi:Family of unknown function (DUF5670)